MLESFRYWLSAFMIAWCLAFVGVENAAGQTYPIPSRDVAVRIDSGIVRNPGDRPVVIWSALVEEADAVWLRLHFESVVLGEVPLSGESSTLRITSVEDGAAQDLDLLSLRRWRHTSAYFNGDAVLVEIIAPPGGRANRIVIDKLVAGEKGGSASSEICGPSDDRVLSDDPRAGRALPVGCTVWLFNDPANCFLTAGHCTSSGRLNVIEFNVPLSNPEGSIQHPPPEDQYAVEVVSLYRATTAKGWAMTGPTSARSPITSPA